MIFSKLAKMTVENLCKMPKFCNQLPLIARSKTATYANFHEIATRNEPFSGDPPLHSGVKEVITLFDIIQE